MKAFITIQSDNSRIFGVGETSEAARLDAMRYTDTLEDTRTIIAEIEADSVQDIDADTKFAEVN